MDPQQNDVNQNQGMPNESGGTLNQREGAPSGGATSPLGTEISGGDKKPLGPVIGVIIIIALIILGGLYLWGGNLFDRGMTPEEILNAEDTTLEDLQAQGTSDEVADIEADLNATDLEGIDAELEQIDRELNNL